MEARDDSRRETDEALLKSILQEICPHAEISMDASLMQDLHVDSVAMLSFIVKVEDTFGVGIGGKEIEENVLQSLSSLLAFLRSQDAHASVDAAP